MPNVGKETNTAAKMQKGCIKKKMCVKKAFGYYANGFT